MKKTRLLAINAFLFALLYGTVTFNKEVLRPKWFEYETLSFITGILPNFLASFFIGLSLVIAAFMRFKKPNWIVYPGFVLILVGLTIEELTSVFGASSYADINDIGASTAGIFMLILIYEGVKYHRSRNIK